jgi:hypothetical protein
LEEKGQEETTVEIKTNKWKWNGYMPRKGKGVVQRHTSDRNSEGSKTTEEALKEGKTWNEVKKLAEDSLLMALCGCHMLLLGGWGIMMIMINIFFLQFPNYKTIRP